MKRFLLRGTTALACASAAALLAASTAAADAPPQAAVGGRTSPIAGPLTLDVTATDDVKLASTAVAVDGVQVATASLCPVDSTTGCTHERAALAVDTTTYPDGIHRLVVTVSDAAGNVTTAVDQDFEIWNHRPTGSSTATLDIGSAPTATPNAGPPGGSKGGVQGSSDSSCRSPKLSMFLDQKPLRVSKGVPVLLKGKRYRFAGRLTCVIKGKRVSAPARSRIDILNIVKGKTVRKGGATVRSAGKITLIVSYKSSRTIEFRYRAADGKTSKVRIKIRIAKKKG
jgi:hypothetical protein